VSALWIEYTAEDGSDVSARWGSHVSGAQFDAIAAYAEKIIGCGPDAVA
jgi:hypothetical protein